MDHEIREPGRVAVPSIRGYWYQILHTVRAWLQAGDDRLIVAEGNEDIDHVLLTTPPSVLEEQIKFRSKTVTQGDEAIEVTALRYLDAFVHHRAKGGEFRGVLRTNAAIAADDDTQVGKWILGKRVNIRAFLREIRSFVRRDENRRLKAFKAINSPQEAKLFINSVEWAPSSGSVEDVTSEIKALVRQRAPDASVEPAVNALLTRMLQTLTNDEVEKRTLRRIDADLVLNDSILDALERSGRVNAERTWRVALWSRAGAPSVAVAIFVDNENGFTRAVDFARRLDVLRGHRRSDEAILRHLAESVHFVAYASFRKLEGRHGGRECLRDVVRQSRNRHTPAEVILSEGASTWIDPWLTKRWPIPTRVDTAAPESLLITLAQIIGDAVAHDPPDARILGALGAKLRWVHRIDSGQYFTAEHPLG